MYLFLRKLKKVPWVIRGFLWRIYIVLLGGKCGSQLLIQSGFFMKYPPHKGIVIGQNVHFAKNIQIDVPIGGQLSIGNNVAFTGDCYISSSKFVKIGNDVLIAEFVSIRDSYHSHELGELIRTQKMVPKEVIIGSDVWIGRGSAILKGSFLEEGTIIGANSLVNTQTTKNGIYVGIPAKLLKMRF